MTNANILKREAKRNEKVDIKHGRKNKEIEQKKQIE